MHQRYGTPEDALEAYEAALGGVCETVGFFRDHATGVWRVEGVRAIGAKDNELTASLALAALVTGVTAEVTRTPTHAEGWLERTRAAFPEQLVGSRFAIRGTHLTDRPPDGRIALVLDAGVAFGSGEHNSTRGCLLALERLARRQPARAGFLIIGTGSGILGYRGGETGCAGRCWPTDIEPWSRCV